MTPDRHGSGSVLCYYLDVAAIGWYERQRGTERVTLRVQVPASSRLRLSFRGCLAGSREWGVIGAGCAMGFGTLSASRAKCLGGLGCTWMVLRSVLRQGTPCSGAVYDYCTVSACHLCGVYECASSLLTMSLARPTYCHPCAPRRGLRPLPLAPRQSPVVFVRLQASGRRPRDIGCSSHDVPDVQSCFVLSWTERHAGSHVHDTAKCGGASG